MTPTTTCAREVADPCPRSFMGHHNFQPRYDVTPPATLEFQGSSIVGERLASSLSKRTYVCDVCTRCGAIVKREAQC